MVLWCGAAIRRTAWCPGWTAQHCQGTGAHASHRNQLLFRCYIHAPTLCRASVTLWDSTALSKGQHARGKRWTVPAHAVLHGACTSRAAMAHAPGEPPSRMSGGRGRGGRAPGSKPRACTHAAIGRCRGRSRDLGSGSFHRWPPLMPCGLVVGVGWSLMRSFMSLLASVRAGSVVVCASAACLCARRASIAGNRTRSKASLHCPEARLQG